MNVDPIDLPVYAACTAALVYFGHLIRKAVHKLDRVDAAVDQIDELTQRELQHNHGGSMKDDAHGMAVSLGILQRDRDDEIARLNRFAELAAEHHPEAAPLYLALLRRKSP